MVGPNTTNYNKQPSQALTGSMPSYQAAVTVNGTSTETTHPTTIQNRCTSSKDQSYPKLPKDQVYKFLIHRNPVVLDVPRGGYASERNNVNAIEGKCKEQERLVKYQGDGNISQEQAPKFKPKYTNADIIFSNGNNRERRRGELFQNYIAHTKFQLDNRDVLFVRQERALKEKLNKLNIPKDFHANGTKAIPNYAEISQELVDSDWDLLETRDHELTRLKLKRRFDKNKAYTKYKKDSFKVYKEAVEKVDANLEKLKQFLIKQKNLLSGIDKDLVDITSNQAEKFYTGFDIKDAEELSSNLENGSDTDSTTASSVQSKTAKSTTTTENKYIPTSIMESLTPLISEQEFHAIVNDDYEILNPVPKLFQQARNGFINGTIEVNGNASDTDGGNTSNQDTTPAPLYTATGRRRAVRPTNTTRNNTNGSSEATPSATNSTSTIRMSRSDANNILNYNPKFALQNPNYISNLIMKHYQFPDEVITDEMEQELILFKKLNDEAKGTKK